MFDNIIICIRTLGGISMRCNNCNNDIPDDSVFCPYCGQKADKIKRCSVCGYELKEDFAFCPVCGNKVDSVKHCPKCGLEIQDGYGFCAACGTRVDETQAQSKKPAKKAKKSNANAQASAILKKINSKRKLIERIAVAVISLIFVICSLFGVVSVDLTNELSELSPEISQYFVAEDDIEIEISAIDLIYFSFFSIGLDKENADSYLNSREVNNPLKDFYNILAKEGSIDEITGKLVLDKKACAELNACLKDFPFLNYTYAQAVSDNEVHGKSSMFVYKLGGYLCLLFIIFNAIVFILSMIGLIIQKDMAPMALTVSVLCMLAFIVVLLSSISTATWTIGGAYTAIVVFAVLYLVYGIAMRVIDNRKLNWHRVASKSVAVVLGIIMLCMFGASAIDVNLYHDYYNDQAVKETAEFKYDFTQFDLFDEYYCDYDSDTRPTVGGIVNKFDSQAKTYTSNRDYNKGDVYFKSSIGLNNLLLNDFMSEHYVWTILLCRVQPIASLISLVFSVILLCYGLAGMCGLKVSEKIKYLALAIILVCAIFNIVATLVLNGCLATTNLMELSLEVGAGIIVQTVFAIIGLFAFGFTGMLKGKELNLNFNKNRKNAKVNYSQAVQSERQNTAEASVSVAECTADETSYVSSASVDRADSQGETSEQQ